MALEDFDNRLLIGSSIVIILTFLFLFLPMDANDLEVFTFSDIWNEVDKAVLSVFSSWSHAAMMILCCVTEICACLLGFASSLLFLIFAYGMN